jgi:hypothetical protein
MFSRLPGASCLGTPGFAFSSGINIIVNYQNKTIFTSDFQAEYERLSGLGVKFQSEPVSAGWGSSVVFDDTCGNLINLVQV